MLLDFLLAVLGLGATFALIALTVVFVLRDALKVWRKGA